MLDGYLLTPLIQKRAVRLPPALTIMAQVLLGTVGGWLGLLIAAPLTAMTLVLAQAYQPGPPRRYRSVQK